LTKDEGVFAVHRGVFDHPIFAPEPYTEREAWLWMLSRAAWGACRIRIGKGVFDLKRGQLAYATRFMATKWKWAHSKVVRFLKRLKTDTMIETLATRDATLITICNYDQYQFGGNATETQVETPNDTQPERQRNKQEEYNNPTKEDSEANASGADAPIDPSIAEREFFVRGREVLGKSSGGQLAKLKAAKGHNVSLARAAIETAATKQKPAEYIAAVIRGPPAARASTVHQQRQVEGREILNELHEFNTSSCGREDSGLLRHDPGDGSEGVRSGLGGNLIALSASRDRSRG